MAPDHFLYLSLLEVHADLDAPPARHAQVAVSVVHTRKCNHVAYVFLVRRRSPRSLRLATVLMANARTTAGSLPSVPR